MGDIRDSGQLAVLQDVLANASGGAATAAAISPETNIKSLGINSLKFIMVMLDIEGRLGRRLFNAQNIGTLETVDDLWQLTLMQQERVETK